MKSKKSMQKLMLNKKTVSNLNQADMLYARGGSDSEYPQCLPTDTCTLGLCDPTDLCQTTDSNNSCAVCVSRQTCL